MVATTKERVLSQTSPELNEAILNDILERIEFYTQHPDQIDRRLDELDEEWDIERLLELNSSALSLIGLTLGFTHSKRWFFLPLAIQAFFLQHSLQGWCPPLPLLRRLGTRTIEEIDYERFALKIIRGDLNKKALPSSDPESSQPRRSGSQSEELLNAVMH